MIINEDEVKGWGSFRSVLKKLIRSVNRTTKISISRNDYNDGVTYSGDAIILNISKSKESSPGVSSSGLSGVNIIWADLTETFIPVADILEDYDSEDYWSIVLAVSNNAFDPELVSYDDGEDLWDDTGTDQTLYRLRVIAPNDDGDPVTISNYGQFREEILCANGKPVNILI